jgi:hypothetical protein
MKAAKARSCVLGVAMKPDKGGIRMLSTLLSAVVAVVLFAMTSAAAFDKNDHTGGKGGGTKIDAGMAMGKDGGDKGDGKGGGKPDKSLGVSGMAMGKDGGEKGDGKGGKPDKLTGMTMSKDGGDKGEGKGGGKKGIIGPSDSRAMGSRQAVSKGQMNRGMDGGNMNRGMDGMDRNLDGLNR